MRKKVRRRGSTFAMTTSLVLAGASDAPRSLAAQTERCQPAKVGASEFPVQYYIADLKPSFPLHKDYSPETKIDDHNYKYVLEGLQKRVGVNGLRLPIFPTIDRGIDYPSLYRDVYKYARELGLLIYASPMSVGWDSFAGWSDERYADWLADYAKTFQPDVLSPLNEAGLNNSRISYIVGILRPKLASSILLAGPDRQHLGATLRSLSSRTSVTRLFDIIDSHNANLDETATSTNWTLLARLSGDRPVWSSENPAEWSHGRRRDIPGIADAVRGGAKAIVIWRSKPTLIDDAGLPTAKACEIAAHLSVLPLPIR